MRRVLWAGQGALVILFYLACAQGILALAWWFSDWLYSHGPWPLAAVVRTGVFLMTIGGLGMTLLGLFMCGKVAYERLSGKGRGIEERLAWTVDRQGSLAKQRRYGMRGYDGLGAVVGMAIFEGGLAALAGLAWAGAVGVALKHGLLWGGAIGGGLGGFLGFAAVNGRNPTRASYIFSAVSTVVGVLGLITLVVRRLFF